MKDYNGFIHHARTMNMGDHEIVLQIAKTHLQVENCFLQNMVVQNTFQKWEDDTKLFAFDIVNGSVVEKSFEQNDLDQYRTSAKWMVEYYKKGVTE